jgi:hypothetical protein
MLITNTKAKHTLHCVQKTTAITPFFKSVPTIPLIRTYNKPIGVLNFAKQKPWSTFQV